MKRSRCFSFTIWFLQSFGVISKYIDKEFSFVEMKFIKKDWEYDGRYYMIDLFEISLFWDKIYFSISYLPKKARKFRKGQAGK